MKDFVVESLDDESIFTPTRRSDDEDERDEVKEVLKLSEKHTAWMRRVRGVVLLLLLSAGVAVTGTTYTLLRHEQQLDFEMAVRYLEWGSNMRKATFF